jgi:hypothetical protein
MLTPLSWSSALWKPPREPPQPRRQGCSYVLSTIPFYTNLTSMPPRLSQSKFFLLALVILAVSFLPLSSLFNRSAARLLQLKQQIYPSPAILSKTPTQLQYQFNSRNLTTANMASYSKELGTSSFIQASMFSLFSVTASLRSATYQHSSLHCILLTPPRNRPPSRPTRQHPHKIRLHLPQQRHPYQIRLLPRNNWRSGRASPHHRFNTRQLPRR